MKNLYFISPITHQIIDGEPIRVVVEISKTLADEIVLYNRRNGYEDNELESGIIKMVIATLRETKIHERYLDITKDLV